MSINTHGLMHADETENKKEEGKGRKQAGWEGPQVATGDNCEALTPVSKVTENVCASRPQAVCPLRCLLTPVNTTVGTQSLAAHRRVLCWAGTLLLFLSTLLGKGFSQADSS